MVGGLRQALTGALDEMVTDVIPNLREGVVPTTLAEQDYHVLLIESGLNQNGRLDRVVEMERRGVRDSFLESLSGIAHQELGKICQEHEAGEPRLKALKQELTECLNGSFELFWGALEALVREPIPLNPENPLDYLAVNEDLALAFIQTAQEHSGDRDNLTQKIDDQCSAHDRTDINNFRGASIPNPVPLFEKFGLLSKAIGGSHEHNIFGKLMAALRDLVTEATGDQQVGFFTPGARKGWLAAFNALRRQHPNLRIYGTPHEYLAMLQDRDHCRVVDSDISQNGDPEGESEISQRLLEAISGEEGLVDQPIVFLSSMRRTGQRVDVNRIMKEIRAEVPSVLFVVDAAQDHYMYPDADIVLYSKRFGGTGTGIMMLKKDSISKEVLRAMAIQEGVNIQLLASTVAGLRCERQPTHFANCLKDLTATPALWNFRGGGTYIDRQATRIAEAISDTPVLNEHFTVSYDDEEPDEANPNLWKSSRIIGLHQKQTSDLDLAKLCLHAEQHGNIQLDWIAPTMEPECETLLDLASQPYSRENCRRLCDGILEFQTTTKPTYFTEMIALPEVFNGAAPMSRDTFERQKEYFLQSIARQNMIRLYIDIQMHVTDIDRLLSSLTSAVSTLRVR